MAKHYLERMAPSPIARKRFAVNGNVVNGVALRKIANGINTAGGHFRKVVFANAIDLNVYVPAGSASTQNDWFWYARTGPNTTKMGALIGMVPTDASTTDEPSAAIEYRKNTVGGAYSSSSDVYLPLMGHTAYNYTPNEIFHTRVEWDVDADTEYEFQSVRQKYGCFVYIVCYEVVPYGNQVDDTLAGFVDPRVYGSEAPILDADIAKLFTAGEAIWQGGSAHLLSWTRSLHGYLYSRTTASYKNVFDATTTPSNSSVGWTIQTSYHDSLARDVPVKFAVLGRNTTAATGDVRLYDGTNALTISGGWTSSAAWQTTTGTIAAGQTRWDLQFRGDGTNQFDLYAACLFEYEA